MGFLISNGKGFTLVELMALMAMSTLLVFTACLVLAKNRQKADQETCLANLNVLGNAYQSWSHDFADQLPWQVSQAGGGSNGRPNAYQHYEVLSNYLSAPQVLVCPTTSATRFPAPKFSGLKDANVSYAVGVDARILPLGTSHGISHSIVAADSNVTTAGKQSYEGICSRAGFIKADAFEGKYGRPDTYKAVWGAAGHPDFGQLLLIDGSVECANKIELRRMLSISQDIGDVSHLLKPAQ